MFGYINVNGKELSDEDKGTYQSYYCGLCKSLKEQFGQKGQMLLNYDMTFLVVLLTGLYETEANRESFKCNIHPIRKRESVRNEISDYAANMNVLLAYYNLIDDWKDDKSYFKKAIAGVYEEDFQKAVLNYPRQAKAVADYIEKLAECEKNQEQNIDLVSALTGEMMGELFAYKQDEWYDELKILGMYLGKFIYLMDAYEDLNKDEKKNSYNPLLYVKKEHPQNYECLCKAMMTSMMAECAKAFERLPILMHATIIRNILYSGVWSKYEYIQLKKKRKNKRKES